MLSLRRDPLARSEVWLAHRVAAAPERLPPGPARRGAVAAAALERRLAEPPGVSLDPSALLAPGAEPPEGGFLLTVDDGTRDFAETLLPLLERYRAHALLFAVPGFADGSWRPYEEELAGLLEGLDRAPVDGRWLPLRDAAERERAYEALRRRWRAAPPPERRAALETLARTCGAALPSRVADDFLGWSELRELDRHPLVTIGAHSLHHALLPALDARAAWEEIAGSKARLERELGHPVAFFAYPYGAHGLRQRRLVRRAGYRLAFATTRAAPLGSRFAVPRRDLAAAPEEGLRAA